MEIVVGVDAELAADAAVDAEATVAVAATVAVDAEATVAAAVEATAVAVAVTVVAVAVTVVAAATTGRSDGPTRPVTARDSATAIGPATMTRPAAEVPPSQTPLPEAAAAVMADPFRTAKERGPAPLFF